MNKQARNPNDGRHAVDEDKLQVRLPLIAHSVDETTDPVPEVDGKLNRLTEVWTYAMIAALSRKIRIICCM